MKIGVGILSYNSSALTGVCLSAFAAKHSEFNLFFVVCDNGSTANEEKVLLDQVASFNLPQSHKCEVLRLPVNVGFSRAYNIVLRHFYKEHMDYVLVLNNDVIVQGTVIPYFLDFLAPRNYPALVSPLLLKQNGDVDHNCLRKDDGFFDLLLSGLNYYNVMSIWIRRKYCFLNYPELLNSDFIDADLFSASCLFGSAETWKLIDGFDDQTYLYYEENILKKRITGVGGKIYLLPKTKVTHLGAQSTRKMRSRKLLEAERDSLLYYLKKYTKMSSIGIFILDRVFTFRVFLNSFKRNNS